MDLISRVVSFLSGEWVLLYGRQNGGGVVIFRTLWVGTLLIFLMSIIRTLADSTSSSYCLDFGNKFLEILSGQEGILFYGAVYAALYARFASQWNYMANLYNQIKLAEVSCDPSGVNKEALAQWKAGYIEDAYVTHMATKTMVAGVIRAWYSDAGVKSAFYSHTRNHLEILSWLIKCGVLSDEKINH